MPISCSALLHKLTASLCLMTVCSAIAAPPPIAQPPFDAKPMTALATPSPVTTLDILGVGLSVEMFRQSQVWQAMQKHPDGSILPTDMSKYPTNATIKSLAHDKRSADALEWGAKYFVEDWPIPAISVWPFNHQPETPDVHNPNQSNYDFFRDRVQDLIRPAGMHYHEIASLGAYFKNEPEESMELIFRFFDLNPQIPALVVLAVDGEDARAGAWDPDHRHGAEEGPRRLTDYSESMVVLVLARRDRVDALRAYAPATHARLENAPAYRPRETISAIPFKPSKYLEKPWTAEQIRQFDHLPIVAVLHRPIRVSYRKDKGGKPTFDPALKASLMSQAEQQAAFKAAFDTALKSVPGNQPARIFYDAGGPLTGRHIVPLSTSLHTSLPHFDLFEPTHGYDTTKRLGNTGAASPFVQWALAAMAGYRNKDASLTINLRQKEEATITAVTYGNDTRVHPMGDPFDFRLAPLDGSPAVPVKPVK